MSSQDTSDLQHTQEDEKVINFYLCMENLRECGSIPKAVLQYSESKVPILLVSFHILVRVTFSICRLWATECSLISPITLCIGVISRQSD